MAEHNILVKLKSIVVSIPCYELNHLPARRLVSSFAEFSKTYLFRLKMRGTMFSISRILGVLKENSASLIIT
jgi:hypothetical protein